MVTLCQYRSNKAQRKTLHTRKSLNRRSKMQSTLFFKVSSESRGLLNPTLVNSVARSWTTWNQNAPSPSSSRISQWRWAHHQHIPYMVETRVGTIESCRSAAKWRPALVRWSKCHWIYYFVWSASILRPHLKTRSKHIKKYKSTYQIMQSLRQGVPRL